MEEMGYFRQHKDEAVVMVWSHTKATKKSAGFDTAKKKKTKKTSNGLERAHSEVRK